MSKFNLQDYIFISFSLLLLLLYYNLLFFILIIHLLIDTLNIQEPLVFIQLKLNKEIQIILH
jgi:hypothetical protein